MPPTLKNGFSTFAQGAQSLYQATATQQARKVTVVADNRNNNELAYEQNIAGTILDNYANNTLNSIKNT